MNCCFGEMGKKSMSRQIQYTDEPIGDFRQIVERDSHEKV